MSVPGAAAAAEIHATFAETIVYTGAGKTAEAVAAVRSDVEADPFAGPGKSLRQVTYEVLKADFAVKPENGETFVADGLNWRVINVVDRDDVFAWVLTASKGAQ